MGETKKGTDKFKVKGIVEILHTNKKGEVLAKDTHVNSVMNIGLAEAAQCIGYNLAGSPARYQAVGIGTTNPDGTDSLSNLDTEVADSGLTRSEGAITNQTTTITNDTIQLIKSWSVTGTKAISETGVFWGSSADDSTMYARKRFSSVYNVVNGDTFQVTYKIILA